MMLQSVYTNVFYVYECAGSLPVVQLQSAKAQGDLGFEHSALQFTLKGNEQTFYQSINQPKEL